MVLKAILAAAASTGIGRKIFGAVEEKIVGEARRKLGLPATASVEEVDTGLAHNQEALVEMMEFATAIRAEQEETMRVAITEQAKSERAAARSEHWLIWAARPMALHASIWILVVACVAGIISVFTGFAEAFQIVLATLQWPVMSMIGIGGGYTVLRSMDKRADTPPWAANFKP